MVIQDKSNPFLFYRFLFYGKMFPNVLPFKDSDYSFNIFVKFKRTILGKTIIDQNLGKQTKVKVQPK